MIKKYSEIVEKVKFNPDLGETVAFEDEIVTKFKGKEVTIKPNTEFEVTSKNGSTFELTNKAYTISITSAEAIAYGGYLV